MTIRKSLIFTLPLTLGLTVSNAQDVFTGDKRLSCEAVLCLASALRPSECMPSIRRYFSIKFSKPHKTITARRNFLNICPTSGTSESQKKILADAGIDITENDKTYQSLKETIVHLPHDCSALSLNNTIQKQKDCKDCTVYYRIAPTAPHQCQALYRHSWTKINPVYIGNGSWSTKRPTRALWFKASEANAEKAKFDAELKASQKTLQWWQQGGDK